MRKRTHGRKRRGIALVVVFVMVMLITLAAYRFSFVMQSEYRMAKLYEEQVDARQSAWSGIEYASSLVDKPPSLRPTLSLIAEPKSNSTDNPFLGELLRSSALSLSASEGEDTWKYALVSPARATIASGVSDIASRSDITPATEQVWRWGLENESAKIPIQLLQQWEKRKPGHAKAVLSRLPGVKPEMIERWLVQAGVVSPIRRIGTTSNFRSQMNSQNASTTIEEPNSSDSQRDFPSFIADSQFGTESESMISEQAIALQWNGGDLNQNYRNDPLESMWLEKQSREAATARGASSTNVQDEAVALQRYITRFSGSRNERSNGSERIFVNDNDLRTLHRKLLAEWPQPLADFVILTRQYGPTNSARRNRRGRSSTDSSSPSDVTLDTRDANQSAIDWSVPGRYQIRSLLELVDSTLTFPSATNSQTNQNKSVVSPFSSRSAEGSNYLIRLLDDCTVDRRPFLEGRIDIWDAPLEVLMAIPDMDEGTASRIISARQDDAIRQQSSSTLAWLLQRRIIDLPKLQQWEPYLTARSDVYTVQALGFRDQYTSIYRCTVTIDGSQKPARPRELKTWHTWDAGFNLAEFVGDQE